MRLITATLGIVGCEGVHEMDALVLDDELWLVPEWIDNYPTVGFSRPARMIRATLLPRSGSLDEPVIDTAIPKAVFFGKPGKGFEVQFLPDQRLPINRGPLAILKRRPKSNP